jgi:hypothetical protein
VKGTLSEVELFTLRTRLYEGRWNEARKGNLAFPLPTGYVRGPEGQWELDPDGQVRERLGYVFELFRREGVARRVVRDLKTNGLELPARVMAKEAYGTVVWKTPTLSTVIRILQNPAYAGAYVYGSRRKPLLLRDRRFVAVARGQHHEGGQTAVVIEGEMQLHRPFGPLKDRPGKGLHTQRDHGRIETQQLVLEAKAVRARGRATLPEQLVEDGLKQGPRPMLVGVRQGRALRGAPPRDAAICLRSSPIRHRSRAATARARGGKTASPRIVSNSRTHEHGARRASREQPAENRCVEKAGVTG